MRLGKDRKEEVWWFEHFDKIKVLKFKAVVNGIYYFCSAALGSNEINSKRANSLLVKCLTNVLLSNKIGIGKQIYRPLPQHRVIIPYRRKQKHEGLLWTVPKRAISFIEKRAFSNASNDPFKYKSGIDVYSFKLREQRSMQFGFGVYAFADVYLNGF